MGCPICSTRPGAPPGTTEESPTDTVMFTFFVGNDTQILVIVAPRLPWYTSYWVATVAVSPFKSLDTDCEPLAPRSPWMTSAPARGFATQSVANRWAGPKKTVGVVTPHVRRHGSTTQSLGTAMPTPW